jgi:parallel beta-helix repeat protein
MQGEEMRPRAHPRAMSAPFLAALALTAGCAFADPPSDAVQVAQPTGQREADRASILAALERVQPGDTVQFAAGTYLIGGEIIRVTVPRITLQGHTEGTTLRGCDPSEFPSENDDGFGGRCNGLELAGGWQTVRDLTFDHLFWALHVGCCWSGRPYMQAGEGGHLIEGNTFRSSSNALRVHGFWSDPTVIRNNRFLNNWHSVAIYGSTVHLLDNDVSAPEPEAVQGRGFPADGIHIARPFDLHESVEGVRRTCENNVVAGNRIDGVTEGIMVSANEPGITCRNNVIRDNTIAVRRARPPAMPGFVPVHDEADSTVVGVPLALRGLAGGSTLEDNLIEGNLIVGAEGLGIEIRNASRNRIVNNTVTGVVRREPFPGNALAALPVLGGDPEAWREANGSGIWISPGSDENEVIGNTFEDIAGQPVFLEGDRNRVEPAAESDTRLAPSPEDTTRYVVLAGDRTGERLVWRDEAGAYVQRLSYGGRELESRTLPGSDGLPARVEITGTHPSGRLVNERFEKPSETRGFYVSLDYEAAFELPLLTRALLASPDGTQRLLPDGEARIEALGRRSVAAEGRSRTLTHYAIHGLDLAPEYVWIDEPGGLFADNGSIREGWVHSHAELQAASAEALIAHGERLLGHLIPEARGVPLVIRNARLFDAASRTVRDGITVVVRDDRIAEVGPGGGVAEPAGAEVIDASGRMVLPGLWEMHGHVHPGFIEELNAPLFLAAGVTTMRDLGNETELMLSLRERTDAHRAVGPRILPGLIIYGPGSWGTLGATVNTPGEARAAVDRFAALGYVQVKLYNPVTPQLAPVIIERARHHGMRVSGHFPNGMTGREAIESGFDEIQHLFYVRIGAAGLRLGMDADAGARMAAVRPETDEWREFVRWLLSHGTVVDPTLAVVEETVGGRPPVWLGRVVERFPARVGRMASHHVGPHAPPPFLVDAWDEITANGAGLVRSLYEAGVPLVAGTDAQIGGFELQRELELWVEAGIPAAEVIALATLGAARTMGMDDELGSIEPGKIADLILVDGDPTVDISDIRRVVSVMKDGRVYDPAAIYRALGIEPCCHP